MTDFGDYEITLKIEESIRRIVQSELNRQRPPTRVAEVVSIDRDNRKVTVVFTGELDEVVIPYNGTAPAEEGQFVRVGGTTHDRYVEDVVGSSDAEARVLELERALATRNQVCYASATPTGNVDFQALRIVPCSLVFEGNAVNVTVGPDGVFTVGIGGVYAFSATCELLAGRRVNSTSYVRHYYSGGNRDLSQSNMDFEDDGDSSNGIGSSPMVHTGHVRMAAGDKIALLVSAQAAETIRAAGTTLVVRLFEPDPIPV